MIHRRAEFLQEQARVASRLRNRTRTVTSLPQSRSTPPTRSGSHWQPSTQLRSSVQLTFVSGERTDEDGNPSTPSQFARSDGAVAALYHEKLKCASKPADWCPAVSL